MVSPRDERMKNWESIVRAESFKQLYFTNTVTPPGHYSSSTIILSIQARLLCLERWVSSTAVRWTWALISYLESCLEPTWTAHSEVRPLLKAPLVQLVSDRSVACATPFTLLSWYQIWRPKAFAFLQSLPAFLNDFIFGGSSSGSSNQNR